MRIGIDANCIINRRGFGRFTRELLGAVAALNTGDQYILFADRQTAEQGAWPDGWRMVVGDTREAASEAAAADGRRSLHDLWAMRRAVQREPLDVMFFPAVYSYFPVGGDVPCLVTFHDVIAETLPHLVFESRRSRWLWQLKSRLAIRRSSCVLTVSEASKQGLMRRFGLDDARVRVLYGAPAAVFRQPSRDTDAHRDALTRHGLHPREPFLLYVGGISPHKNLTTLIDAFARVRVDPALDALHLVLVGDYAGDVFRTCHEELVEYATRLGVADRVRFPGFVPDEDLVHLYAATAAFVFPSYLEGFGLPAAEAMACGAPVIASTGGSLPEVLAEAGDLFDPHDVEGLAERLRRVLHDPAYQQELRGRSLRRARAFSWEQTARRAVDVFHEYRGN